MPQVFISYGHVTPDAGCAEQLRAFLDREGFDVFIDTRIPGGRRWAEEIASRLATSEHFVVLLSAESIASDMLRQEVADAHAQVRRGLRVFPSDCSSKVPYPTTWART